MQRYDVGARDYYTREGYCHRPQKPSEIEKCKHTTNIMYVSYLLVKSRGFPPPPNTYPETNENRPTRAVHYLVVTEK